MDIPLDKTIKLFDFTESGYSGPALSREISMSEIKSAIVGMELQRDYLKSCQEYIIGYEFGNLQVIRADCVYGGIRDLQSFIDIQEHIVNLHAYIRQSFTGQSNIVEVLKGFGSGNYNIDSTIKGWASTYTDLYNYLRQSTDFSENLQVYLSIFNAQQENLHSNIKGYSTGNIVDILNAIHVKYNAILDIPSYLKIVMQQDEDLSTVVYKILQREQKELNKILHGWQEIQLQKIITSFHTFDLPILLRSTYFNNLTGFLYAIQPFDIKATLMSWAVGDLSVQIAKGDYGGDLGVSVLSISPRDLNFKIYVKRGLHIVKDLNARLTNLCFSDLSSTLKTIQFYNLGCFLNSTRLYADLVVKIYPKIIYLKHHLNVSFLENLDLAAVINFSCFSSMYCDLASYLVIKNSKDLKSYIYGYDYSNILDLGCAINASDYLSMNTVNINYFHDPQPESNVVLRYVNKQPYYYFNRINLWTDTFNRDISNLQGYINGNYLTKDLSVFIRVCSNLHYQHTGIKETFIVLKLKNNREDFRRYVELKFNSSVKEYIYFSGEQKAYNVSLDSRWVICVEGHRLLPVGYGFEKTKVKKKYIFNLKNYTSIDEAVKDMIDRVTNMKSFNLPAFIEATNDRMADLHAYLKSKRLYKSNRVLGSSLRPAHPAVSDLTTTLNSVRSSAFLNLFTTIVPIASSINYGSVDFDFFGDGDPIPTPSSADFLFDLEGV